MPAVVVLPGVFLQTAVHGPAGHVVAVKDGDLVGKVGAVGLVHHDGTGGVGRPVGQMVQVIGVVPALDHRIIHGAVRQAQPAHHVPIASAEGLEVHRRGGRRLRPLVLGLPLGLKLPLSLGLPFGLRLPSGRLAGQAGIEPFSRPPVPPLRPGQIDQRPGAEQAQDAGGDSKKPLSPGEAGFGGAHGSSSLRRSRKNSHNPIPSSRAAPPK